MYAFVLMPFKPEFNDVYELGIKAAAEQMSVRAERLDDQIFASNMLEKIYTEIDSADFIIADVSEKNPNVFYEVGYCVAKKKIVILLTNNRDDIPFDFLHSPHIIYDSVSKLKKELVKKIDWAKKEVASLKSTPLKLNIKTISTFLDVKENHDVGHLELRIEFHNITGSSVKDIGPIYLLTGGDWRVTYSGKNCNSDINAVHPYSLRHIISPDFSSIPPKDMLFIDVKLQKTLYSEWSQSVKQDRYVNKGRLSVVVNSGDKKFTLFADLEHVFEEDDLPF